MPFGIPSEDFHGGFGIPEDEVCVINYDDTDGDIEEYIRTPEKTGAAMKHISELMDKYRAEHPEFYIVDAKTGENRGPVVQDDYDPYTGKYAFVSPDDDISDEEYESAAEEAHDNLVRSLIEAGGEIRELKELLREAKDALLYMLILHKAQDPRCNQEKVVPALYMLQSEPDKWTPERADEVFKKIFDYLEKEEDNGPR